MYRSHYRLKNSHNHTLKTLLDKLSNVKRIIRWQISVAKNVK